MKKTNQNLIQLIEICLISFLVLLPFSTGYISNRVLVLMSLVGLGTGFFIKFVEENQFTQIFLSVILMLTFGLVIHLKVPFALDWGEKTNYQIPIASIILFIAVTAWLIRIALENQIQIIQNTFVRSVFGAFVFILFCTSLTLPFFKYYYQIETRQNLELIKRITEYIFLTLLITDNIKSRSQQKRISAAIVISFLMTIVYSFL